MIPHVKNMWLDTKVKCLAWPEATLQLFDTFSKTARKPFFTLDSREVPARRSSLIQKRPTFLNSLLKNTLENGLKVQGQSTLQIIFFGRTNAQLSHCAP